MASQPITHARQQVHVEPELRRGAWARPAAERRCSLLQIWPFNWYSGWLRHKTSGSFCLAGEHRDFGQLLENLPLGFVMTGLMLWQRTIGSKNLAQQPGLRRCLCASFG